MRPNLFVIAGAVVLGGCGTTAGADMFEDVSGAGTAGASDGGDQSGSDGSGADGSGPDIGPAIRMASGQAALVGVTSDGWAVFRDADTLRAAKISPDADAAPISERPGNVLIRGNVVFNWADVDWTVGIGELSVWTAALRTHEVGPTPYAEGLVAASEQGSTVVYTANTQDGTTDLMLANSDLSSPQVLIEAMGIGSEATCSASLGFVGERLFVGWCEVDSRVARIERYEYDGEAWTATLIADDALPTWSADGIGDRVFYQSSQYSAYFAEKGAGLLIDSGVSRGLMLPDGSGVLYTVGDQLRRSALPDVKPIPIVTTGYKQPIEFSSGFDAALYSTTVTYDDGTRRDLWLASTDGFDLAPIELVSEPVAALGRSSMTQDGRYVLYLTDVTPSGGSLHVVARDGGELMVLPNVLEVAAANDSTLVFTDNSSDPDQYPIVADLKLIDLESETTPRLIEAKILDGRSFQLDPSRGKVAYVRSGVDTDAAEEDRVGLFFRTIR